MKNMVSVIMSSVEVQEKTDMVAKATGAEQVSSGFCFPTNERDVQYDAGSEKDARQLASHMWTVEGVTAVEVYDPEAPVREA